MRCSIGCDSQYLGYLVSSGYRPEWTFRARRACRFRRVNAPKLRNLVISFNMDMEWFRAITGVEKETVRT